MPLNTFSLAVINDEKIQKNLDGGLKEPLFDL